MKKILLIIIVAAAAYYGFNTLNKSESVATESPERQGALTEFVDDINETLENAQEASKQTETTEEELALEQGQESQASVIEESSTVSSEESKTQTEVVVTSGKYIEYKDVDIASIDGKIVLDFYAPWCPSCRKLEADINDSLNDIPSNVTIVKVDYDSETELKQKYNVTKQHTFIQIDNQGNLIQKWSGGTTLESIVGKLK